MTPLQQILAVLEPLNDEERKKLLMELDYVYCVCCGCKHPDTGHSCQCWNDE